MERRGFTLIEVLVVVAIIALLLSILLPSLSRAREQGKAAVCLSNMRQLGLAVHMYANNHRGHLVDFGLSHGGSVDEKRTWLHTLERDYGNELIVRCASDASPYWDSPHPDTSQPRRTSYGVNDYLTGRLEGYEEYRVVDRIRRPATTILFVEMIDGTEMIEDTSYATSDHVHAANWVFNPREEASSQVAIERHMKRSNYTFIDSHVEPRRFEETYEVTGSRRDITFLHNMYDPKKGY